MRTDAAQRDPRADARPGRGRHRHHRLRRLRHDHPQRRAGAEPSLLSGVLLVVMGGLVLWLARPVRRYLQGRATTSLDPLRAARTVVLAQAAALTGSAAAGWYLGQLVVVLTDLSLDAEPGPAAAARGARRRRRGPRGGRARGPALVPRRAARRGRRRGARPGRLDRTVQVRGTAPRRPVVSGRRRSAGTRQLLRAVSSSASPEARPYLSTSPTTKNIDPSTATMSATRQPGSTFESTCTLLNDAERSLSRHGVFSPRETR